MDKDTNGSEAVIKADSGFVYYKNDKSKFLINPLSINSVECEGDEIRVVTSNTMYYVTAATKTKHTTTGSEHVVEYSNGVKGQYKLIGVDLEKFLAALAEARIQQANLDKRLQADGKPANVALSPQSKEGNKIMGLGTV